ncbi:hypothetical protein GCM10010218_47290 [Streptomyces mashuensis]|uniref:Uncharacterized protein n=1 Tax=Streptomyces mashuensis TaxID=33904 RepID=A0A919EE02_9ACTN|nr:hypothetical protein GCM10010218_47290 [Streptomyces mashuensis]
MPVVGRRAGGRQVRDQGGELLRFYEAVDEHARRRWEGRQELGVGDAQGGGEFGAVACRALPYAGADGTR